MAFIQNSKQGVIEFVLAQGNEPETRGERKSSNNKASSKVEDEIDAKAS